MMVRGQLMELMIL